MGKKVLTMYVDRTSNEIAHCEPDNIIFKVRPQQRTFLSTWEKLLRFQSLLRAAERSSTSSIGPRSDCGRVTVNPDKTRKSAEYEFFYVGRMFWLREKKLLGS